MTTYNLDIPDELWERFKDNVPKSSTLNDIIIVLIKKFLEEKE